MRIYTYLKKFTNILTSIDKQKVLLIVDIIYISRTIKDAMDALNSWGIPQRVMLFVMVDKGHRKLSD